MVAAMARFKFELHETTRENVHPFRDQVKEDYIHRAFPGQHSIGSILTQLKTQR